MAFKHIGTKILTIAIPVITVSMVTLNVVSVHTCRGIIDKQISAHMTSELNSQMNQIEAELSTVSNMATVVSRQVGSTYKSVPWDQYESALQYSLSDTDMAMGSGLWFEPNVYDQSKQYYGPYVVKNSDGTFTTTWDYSNADYDYFNQEYYLNAKNSKSAVFTSPYYDTTSGTIMSSCSDPIVDASGKFIGCVTVDMNLTKIQEIVKSIKVGTGGSAMLITGDGSYIYSPDVDNSEKETKITEDANQSLADVGTLVLNNTSGETSYTKDGKVYELYYSTLPIGWKMMIQIPRAELNGPINNLIALLTIACAIFVLTAAGIIYYLIYKVSKGISKVSDFSNTLAENDFTVSPLEVTSADELGAMSESLNTMYTSNKDVISEIAEHAKNIEKSSEEFSEAADSLKTQFDSIQKYMSEVNEAMMSSSAATEEVNASSEEVSASVGILSEETKKAMEMSAEIKTRASEIETTSQNSYDHATELSTQYQTELQKSIEASKIVDSIEDAAKIIKDIASQINLLSLNASIEAARAGDAGKGFSVVAIEIGKLANETSDAVKKIQDTISSVQNAFGSLVNKSQALLSFVTDTVTPDYEKFVGVAKQYGEDANSVEQISTKIDEMSANIDTTMGEVTLAIQNIAESTQTTATNSSKVTESVSNVAETVKNVASMSKDQDNISKQLSSVVGKYKL